MIPFSMFRPRQFLSFQVHFHCIASLAFSSFNFEFSTLKFPAACPFSAIPTDHRQLKENTTTSTRSFATVTLHLKGNPFVCHSYKKHRGWGLPVNPRCSPKPMRFPLFPQRVNIEQAASPATPIGSCAYFALLCIPGVYLSPPTLPPSRVPILVLPLSRSRQAAQNVRRWGYERRQ